MVIKNNQITGDVALALGALEANVRLVIGYPGIPGSRAVEYLQMKAFHHPLVVQWSNNVQWALEAALGASLVGTRTFVNLGVTSLNSNFDALRMLLYTRINAGFVIVIGDNQDSLSSLELEEPYFYAELPLFEPANPEEGQEMVIKAFELSEEQELPVLLRINTEYCQSRSTQRQMNPEIISPEMTRGLMIYDHQNFSILSSSEGYQQLRRRLSEIGQIFELSPFNRVEGSGQIGIIAIGQMYNKINTVLGDDYADKFSVLKLGTLNPIPQATIAYFLENVSHAFIFEDNGPIIEKFIHRLVKHLGCETRVYGRLSKHIPRDKILYEWQIEEVLTAVQPAFRPHTSFLPKMNDNMRLQTSEICRHCDLIRGLNHIYHVLTRDFSRNLPIIISDRPCHLQTDIEKYPHLFFNYSNGSVIGIATGIAKSQKVKRVVAITDAATFVRKGIDPLIQASLIKANVLLLIVNKVEIVKEVSDDAFLEKDFSPHFLPLDNLINVCQVDMFETVETSNLEQLEACLITGVNLENLAVIVLKNNCELIN
ncbi:hypothetical protein JW964_20335 [candidate division KSB1 bacterium]|nr:hypothetical protein [candidate division KSB1 bacterium]